MSELIIVRHGETTGESSFRLYGGTDIDLSDSGREQMRLVGSELLNVDFKAIYASPLRRSRESAEIIRGGRDCEIKIVPGFREINFGGWEGWSFDEAAERDPENHSEWKKGLMSFKFPNGDLKSEFFEGAGRAAMEVFNSSPLPALAVLHKGVIKGVLSSLMNISMEEVANYHVELGSIHRLRREPDGSWSMISTNETGHLAHARIPSSK